MPTIRDFLMPDLGEGLTEGEINRWLVAEGDVVVVDQPIAEITTEKAVVEVPTPFAGRVATLHGAAGEIITVGRPLISIEVAGAPATSESGNVLVGYGTSEAAPRSRRGAPVTRQLTLASIATVAMPPASPLVRRRAAELGIDLSTIAGTGPGGIVTQADLERAGAGSGASTPSAAPSAIARGVRTPLTGIDRISAERLTRSHRDVPTATAWLTADATRLMAVPAEREGSRGARATPFALILRLCVRALQKFPRLNAHFDTQTNEIVAFDSIHLGVAVQTERGLVVAVIREAQRKSSGEITSDLTRLATAARDGSIDAADLRGSTFTVSNFGAFGVDGGTAIINPPEAAILGVGRIASRPWVVDAQVVPRSVVELSLVFDHRVADGALAGGFIRHVADLIEAPEEALADDSVPGAEGEALRRAQADTWVYFDGALCRYGDAHLGLLTHALHYGTGCFEGIRAYWSKRQHRINVFRMADHFARMTGNARMLHMQLPHSVDELCDITVELLRRNAFATDVYVRPLIYKANEEIGIRFHNLRDGFMIVPVPFGAYVDTTGGLRCQVSSWRRIDDNVAPARSKASGIYINSALAKTEAFLNGFDEAILMTQEGHVCEGSAENLFILRRGQLITPPASENIVEGITRSVLMTFARDELGVEVVERTIDRSELYVADEVLLCGTGAEVSAVIEIDQRTIGSGSPGPLTRKLQHLYFAVCKGEDDRYASWLTPIV